MQTRQLGNSDMRITPIGFGAWAIGGNGWTFGWGTQDDADSVATIHEALDLGINWIDTAAVYGLGHSEEVVAKALAGSSAKPYVFTKCERIFDEKTREIGKSLKSDSIRRECEASLKRLKRERIDLYQIHWPEPDEDIEEGWETLVKLKAEGKVRWIGVSNFNAAQMERIARFGPITSLQPNYSLLNTAIETEALPYAGKHGIGVIAYSPMGSGMLTGKMTRERIAALPGDDWRRNNKHYKEPLLERSLGIVDLLGKIAARHGVTAGQVAIAWVLARPEVTAAIVGARKPGQLKELVGAADLKLSNEEMGELRKFLDAHPAS